MSYSTSLALPGCALVSIAPPLAEPGLTIFRTPGRSCGARPVPRRPRGKHLRTAAGLQPHRRGHPRLPRPEDKQARERAARRDQAGKRRGQSAGLIEGQSTSGWREALNELAIAYSGRFGRRTPNETLNDLYIPEVTSSLFMALTCGCAAKVGIVAG
jgi:hypothetical protein